VASWLRRRPSSTPGRTLAAVPGGDNVAVTYFYDFMLFVSQDVV